MVHSLKIIESGETVFCSEKKNNKYSFFLAYTNLDNMKNL